MSDIEDTKLQFQVLRRHFLFRVVDVEVLSAHAQGDANKLLGQFVALVFFVSFLASFPLLGFDPSMPLDARRDFSFSMEHFLIATTMLAVGIFGVLSWDSIFPDRRDVLVLAPLPVRAQTMFLAKAAAMATALTVVVIALNAATGLGWPLAFAALTPSARGFVGVVRCYAAYWLTMLAAGAFIYCGLLSVQSFFAQILPRRLFLRISGFLQMATFCLFVCAYFLEPPIDGVNMLASPQMHRVALWVPTYWFFALFNELIGSMNPVLAALSRRAWLGLAIAALSTAVAYALSYMRSMRQILEDPDITSSARGLGWLPPFGSQPQTAIGQFAVRSLARSRQHRLILAFFLGIGLAFTILLVQVFLQPLRPTGAQPVLTSDLWRDPTTPVLAASTMMLVLAVVGVRVVFTLPLELSANWIFRGVGVRPGPQMLIASRRALLFLSVAPVWVATAAAVCVKSWPWREAVEHLFVLGLLGIILADIAFYSFRKIPFTCSYLPGKSQANMVFLAAIGLVVLVAQSVLFERQALKDPRMATLMLILLGAAAACLRWRTMLAAKSYEKEPQFEELDSSALLDLGLCRDGGVIGTARPDPPLR